MDDWRLRVCLERIVELPGAHLRLREWPGLAGPIVHVQDPLGPDDTLVGRLAETLAPAYRIMSLTQRGSSTYQVDAADLLGTLDQFGFATPVVFAERLACVAALLHAAWQPSRLAGLVLVDFDPSHLSRSSDGLAARALQDCPPDWGRLWRAVECPVLVLSETSALVEDVQSFLAQLGSGVA